MAEATCAVTGPTVRRPDPARARRSGARAPHGPGDYSAKSLELASSAAGALPESSKARFLLGTVLLAQGRDKDALGHLEMASKRDPGLLGARLNLARTYMRLSRPQDAARELKEVLRLDPGNVDARNGLAIIGKSQ